MTAMTVTRRNIIDSTESGERFVQGAVQLNQEMSGLTTAELNDILNPQIPGFRIFGLNQEVSVWDLFVLWHFVAMQLSSSPPRPLRNLAHGGPVFLPWHRMFLIRLEEQLQRVTSDAEAALPYWDWAADGDRPAADQPQAPLWDLLGETSGEVASGPLAAMQVRLFGFQMQLWSIEPRPLVRNAAGDELAPPCPPQLRSRGPWRTATTTSSFGTPAWTASATELRDGSTRRPAPGFLRSHGTTTGSTSGSVGTWARAPPPTIPCSTSTTATRIESGSPGWPGRGSLTDRSTATPAHPRAIGSTIRCWPCSATR
jgi:hypothetical protein